MAIRKRSALLLGLLGFLSGVLFAQCQRKGHAVAPQHGAKSGVQSKPKQIPMQTVNETLSTARQNSNKAGYTTH